MDLWVVVGPATQCVERVVSTIGSFSHKLLSSHAMERFFYWVTALPFKRICNLGKWTLQHIYIFQVFAQSSALTLHFKKIYAWPKMKIFWLVRGNVSKVPSANVHLLKMKTYADKDVSLTSSDFHTWTGTVSQKVLIWIWGTWYWILQSNIV